MAERLVQSNQKGIFSDNLWYGLLRVKILICFASLI